jgi:predicted transcriptional regulator
MTYMSSKKWAEILITDVLMLISLSCRKGSIEHSGTGMERDALQGPMYSSAVRVMYR